MEEITEAQLQEFRRGIGALRLSFADLVPSMNRAAYSIKKFSSFWLAGFLVEQISTPEARFESALASAAGWRQDALLYQGERHRIRIRHAERMEAIAEDICASLA